jgi:glycosyltransferase involved in cell wall biosynthesis
MEDLRVLHLVRSFSPGGRRSAIASLVQAMARLGVGGYVGCLEPPTPAAGDVTGLAGEPEMFGARVAFSPRLIRRLMAYCRQRRIDLLHAHDGASQWAAALVRLRLPGLRLVMTFHRTLGFESASRRDRIRNALATALSHAVVTGSRERRVHFLEQNWASPRKVVRIPFGVDTDRFRPDAGARGAVRAELGLSPETIVIGVAGHFGPEKGIDQAIHAWNVLLQHPGPRPLALVILGDGSPAQGSELRRLAREGPAAQVIFAGFRPDPERWFRAFDLFLHAARQEAFGLVLCEAMATGLPVVAAGVGGVPDIVDPGRTGLLAPPGEVHALADALFRLICDRDRRRRMAVEARRRAETEYDSGLYARRHLRLYRELLAGGSPARFAERGAAGPTPALETRK